MKTLKPHAVTTYLKNQKNLEILLSENLSKDKTKISNILKSANRIILIYEESKF